MRENCLDIDEESLDDVIMSGDFKVQSLSKIQSMALAKKKINFSMAFLDLVSISQFVQEFSQMIEKEFV